MRRKTWLGIGLLAAAAAGWAAFRPERLWIDQSVSESFPMTEESAGRVAGEVATAANQRLATGIFHDGAHETSGTATVYRLPNGKRILRLADFMTSNGPDVQLYLVKASDATDNDTVKQAGFINLGALKGNVGDQNYDLPDDVDLDAYRAVTVWCRRFGVNFGTAPLVMAGATPNEPAALTSGAFHSVAHETRGTATVFALAGGKRILRLTDFMTSNGPDVQVYLVKAPDATDNDTVKQAGFVHVAALKGNVGDQNYDLPADVDLSQYRAVTIWCRRFGVNFGTAPLAPIHS
jgi:hypothetical protein